MKGTDWRTQKTSGLPGSTLISYLSVSLHRKSWERSLSPDMETKGQICLLPISDTRNPREHLGWDFPSQGSNAKERVSLPLSSLAYHLDCWNSCYLTFSPVSTSFPSISLHSSWRKALQCISCLLGQRLSNSQSLSQLSPACHIHISLLPKSL